MQFALTLDFSILSRWLQIMRNIQDWIKCTMPADENLKLHNLLGAASATAHLTWRQKTHISDVEKISLSVFLCFFAHKLFGLFFFYYLILSSILWIYGSRYVSAIRIYSTMYGLGVCWCHRQLTVMSYAWKSGMIIMCVQQLHISHQNHISFIRWGFLWKNVEMLRSNIKL